MSRVPLAVAAGLLVVLAVGFWPILGGLFLASGSCSEEEREVFAEFPQYGGIEKEPETSTESGGCAIFYDTRSSQERVAGYYSEQLRTNGWEVEETEHETTVLEGRKRTFEEVEIRASRGDFFYNVLFESHEYYDHPRSDVHVAVHVFESSKKPLPPCGSVEKAALEEFTHYGGADVGKELEAFPLPGKAKGACVTGYPAKGASQKQVAAYYEEKLSEHGWEVKQRSSSTEATREGLRYVARYWPNPGSTEVEVQVFKVK